MNAPHIDLSTQGFVGAGGGIHLGEGVYIFHGEGAPVNGTSGTGAGWAGIGSLYINRTSGTLTQNTGTKASPTWTTR
jgi:hypothetical protein